MDEHQEGGGRGRFGIYLGTVIDNRDPEQRGRVRVLVPSVNAREVLPTWAPPMGQSYGGERNRSQVGGAPERHPARGHFLVPEVDATVVVMFLEGNPALPMWMPGPPLAADVYPDVKSPEGATSDAYPSKSMLARGRSLTVLEHEHGELDVTMDGAREVRIDTQGAKLSVRTLPDNPVILNDGSSAQLAARVGDEVDIGDFTFVGVFSPTSGALTSLTISFPDGTAHTLTALSPSASFTNVKGVVATGAPKVWIGGNATRVP